MTTAMATIREDKTLRLHTDTLGALWCMYGDGQPQSCGDVTTIGEIPREQLRHVRVPGMRRNAATLLELQTLRLQGHVGRVEVGTPLLGETQRERDCPSTMLQRMRAAPTGVASSLGGWHNFDDMDYAAYAVADALDRGDPSDTLLQQLLQAHPAWLFLQRLPHLNLRATAAVLAHVLDPRWFVDRERPESGSKLQAYLGLRETTVAAAMNKTTTDATGKRCSDVLAAWWGVGPTEPDSLRPGHYLWRKWFTHENQVRAAQRVSQDFVTFLRLTWLDALMRRSARATEWLFDPSQWFGDDTDGVAFRQYRNQLPK